MVMMPRRTTGEGVDVFSMQDVRAVNRVAVGEAEEIGAPADIKFVSARRYRYSRNSAQFRNRPLASETARQQET